MKKLLFACLLILGFSRVKCQTEWIRVDEVMGNFIVHRSLLPITFGDNMPICGPSVTQFIERFDVHEFSIRNNGKIFRLKGTYLDLSSVDTSDISNYYRVYMEPIQANDTAPNGLNVVSAPLIQAFDMVKIDTGLNNILKKNIEGELRVFRYFWNIPDSSQDLLKRITGNTNDYVSDIVCSRSNFWCLSLVSYWETGQTPPKSAKTYSVENLRYIASGDTFTVYGSLQQNIGISYRDQMMEVTDHSLASIDKSHQILIFAFGDRYNKKDNRWELDISSYYNPERSRPIVLNEFYYYGNEDTFPGVIACDSPGVDVELVKFSNKRYHIVFKRLPSDNIDRLITLKIESPERKVSTFQVQLNYLINDKDY